MRDTLDMSGKVALITGAGRGMGEATARLFASHGAAVMLADISEASAQRVAAEIRQAGGSAEAVQVDVSDEASVAQMAQAALTAYGAIDCSVNAAGVVTESYGLHEEDMAEFDRIIAINLRGTALSMKYAIAQMLKQGRGGTVVNFGSANSVRPQPHAAAYTASKHGVIGLTKVASMDYAPKGIRVNAIMPGAIDTPMLREGMDQQGWGEETVIRHLSLLGRLGQPAEVAEAALWLSSASSSYVTGHALAVDAGFLSR